MAETDAETRSGPTAVWPTVDRCCVLQIYGIVRIRVSHTVLTVMGRLIINTSTDVYRY